MLQLTVSFSRAESPWLDAVASSYRHTRDRSSIFKSVVNTKHVVVGLASASSIIYNKAEKNVDFGLANSEGLFVGFQNGLVHLCLYILLLPILSCIKTTSASSK